MPILNDYEDDSYEDEDPTIELTTSLSGVSRPTIVQEAFPDEYFDADESSEESSEEEEVRNSDEGLLKHNTKSMTFYHCLFGGYGPSGTIPGVGHVGAIFMHRRAPIVAPLPPSFPLGMGSSINPVVKF